MSALLLALFGGFQPLLQTVCDCEPNPPTHTTRKVMQGASLVVPAAISLPLVLLVAIAMLIAQLGWAILGGLVVLVLFLPYNASVCKR